MKKLIVTKKTFNRVVSTVHDIEVAEDHHYIIENGLVSHNSAQIYASDIVVSINKRKLKDDEDGNKSTEVTGIRSKIKCVKTRYAKPFEEVEVHIPYVSGMDAYSGMFDLCEKKIFVKEGNRYRYSSTDGTEHKLFRKDMTPEFFDMIIKEWNDDKITEIIHAKEEISKETC